MNRKGSSYAIRGWCLLAASILQGPMCSDPLRAEVVPVPGPVDGRIRSALYDSEQVYRLQGVVGYQIDVEFEAGESFVGLGAGDIEALTYFGQDNHLFLKPKASSVATNLTVLTNRRRYQFSYSASGQSTSGEERGAIFAVRFLYPPRADQSTGSAAAKRIETALGTASDTRVRNANYWYCGSAALRPVAASDDGVHTRLRFAANGDLPAIFVRNPDGSESLLNFNMESGDVIVHRLAQRLILRRGNLTGCIVNRGFMGGGVRLDSGTVTPAVERDVPRVVP